MIVRSCPQAARFCNRDRSGGEVAMELFSLFRRKPRIRTPAQLADFIDENASFLVQKGIFEYARARAGVYAKMLMVEPEFLRLAELARWRAYPMGLAMVGEMAAGLLRDDGRTQDLPADDVIEPLFDVVLDVFDRYPVPAVLDGAEWQAARAELRRRLDLTRMHPTKLAKDIPVPYLDGYFALMPIHERLRGQDLPTVRNYLMVTLCNIHEDLNRRLDKAELLTALVRKK
jgi:hypothetical protein